MRNLARATAVAGLAVAFGAIAAPSASAAVHEAAGTAKSKSSAASSKAASAKQVEKATAKAIATRPVTVNIYYVMHDGRVISEQGPGDSAAYTVESNNGAIDVQSQTESIKTGDLRAEGKGNHSPTTFEVEGSEQDQGEPS